MLSYSPHALISTGATASVEGVVGSSDTSVRRHVSEHQEVVLDVPQGTAVVFRKKVPYAAMCSACLICGHLCAAVILHNLTSCFLLGSFMVFVHVAHACLC